MTRQYIAGELSLRLGELQAVTTDQERARESGACVTRRRRYRWPSWDPWWFAHWEWQTASAGTRSGVVTPWPSAARQRSARTCGNSASVPSSSRKTSSSIK